MNKEVTKPEPHPVDKMTSLELTNAMVSRFGAQRTVELFGWIFIIGPLSDIAFKGEPGALRTELERRGMTRSAIYRALVDFRTLGQELEQGTWPMHDHTKTYQFVNRMFAVCSL